jgi:hypothetical protein
MIEAILYIGLGLTLLATVFPFIDRATTTVLADHIRDGYPAYDSHDVSNAVTAWLVILTTIGVLGVAGWLVTARAVRAGKAWNRWLATGLLSLAFLLAVTGLTTRDTSGEVGLAPLLGWLQVLPLFPGVAAVVFLWQRREQG